MLPRIIYKKVLKSVEHYRKQHEEDRLERPNDVPCEWGRAIEDSIRHHMREDHQRCTDADVRGTMEYLVKQGIMVPHPYGGYMFPLPKDAAPLPSKEEFVQSVLKKLNGPQS